MNKTGLVLVVSAICLLGVVMVADEASAAEFPSVKEIFDTIQWPDYTFDTFLADMEFVFSEGMISSMGTYLGELVTFVVEDTFIGDLFSGEFSTEAFEGDSGYVNVFLLACILIALVCILGAMITYFANRKTFEKKREHV